MTEGYIDDIDGDVSSSGSWKTEACFIRLIRVGGGGGLVFFSRVCHVFNLPVAEMKLIG